MQPEQLYHVLQQRPFQPMRVYLKDGRAYDIPLREMAVVGVTYLDIGIQAPDEPEGICATVVTVSPEDILRLAPVIATAPS